MKQGHLPESVGEQASQRVGFWTVRVSIALGEAANPDSLFILKHLNQTRTGVRPARRSSRRYSLKVESRKLSRILLFIIIGIIVPLIHACALGMFTTQDSQSRQSPSAISR